MSQKTGASLAGRSTLAWLPRAGARADAATDALLPACVPSRAWLAIVRCLMAIARAAALALVHTLEGGYVSSGVGEPCE